MPNIMPIAESLIGLIIDQGRLCLLEPLGRGSGGVVFRAVDLSTSIEYAVKCLVKADKGSRQYNFQKREIRFHQAVSGHRNIITLHRVVDEGKYDFLVLDYCRGGDLFKFLTEKGTYRRNNQIVKDVFVQLIDAVDTCHKNGVYHRDIKPENIMCNEDGTEVRLGDFGLSTDSRWSSNFGAGTAGYMSPECIGAADGPESYCSRSNDIWALGVILTSMISGHNPWRRAVMTDDCFRTYVGNSAFFRQMLPISAAADAILRRIFTNHERRITLSKLRRMILDVDTFFMSDDEIAESGNFVQIAAASYLCGPPDSSSRNSSPSSTAARPDIEGVESSFLQAKDGDSLAQERLVEINLSTMATYARTPVAEIPPAPGMLSNPTTLVSPVHSDIESHRTRVNLRRPLPPPQPMPSYKELMRRSSVVRSDSTDSARMSRRTCGRDSPMVFLRRLMDRILV